MSSPQQSPNVFRILKIFSIYWLFYLSLAPAWAKFPPRGIEDVHFDLHKNFFQTQDIFILRRSD